MNKGQKLDTATKTCQPFEGPSDCIEGQVFEKGVCRQETKEDCVDTPPLL